MIAGLLEGRFGTLDAEMSGLVDEIARMPLPEPSQLLLSLMDLSREDWLALLRAN
ncbi:hypothetical protein V0288_01885 [Pannus brasiliensis CCIBt3594]|uniref:Uncharacterized protein n=1 Tax=Pannus brasiliensis CCIBt3594 TaxID=1427578 RepID=A0AAW9QDM1_9CHRO